MKPRTYKKVGKFKFKRPPSPKIRKNERLRKLATSGKLTTIKLEKHIVNERKKGYPVKYSKPIGFRKSRKRK
tara:strand:+ start:5518 stop:5733 length:216 start_codon:yes stop_codon:yes gene_type:complete